jgi:nitrogen fixation protein
VEEPAGANWGAEEIVYEGPPARGEIIANVAMSWTLVWLPLTISAIGRGLWASYKITDKRVVVMSTSPLRTERTDVPIEEIVDVIAIGRGVGLWGDMVITLKNQEKIELRSLPDFKKLEEHIKSRMGEADPEYAKI